MNYWDWLIGDIASNLGFAFPDLMLLISTLSCLIFFSKDIKVGLVLLFLLTAVQFALAYILSWPTTNPLILLFLILIALAFSIYLSSNKTIIN